MFFKVFNSRDKRKPRDCFCTCCLLKVLDHHNTTTVLTGRLLNKQCRIIYKQTCTIYYRKQMQEEEDSARTVECEEEESNAWTHAVTTFCLLYPHNNAEVNAVDEFLRVTSLIPGVPVGIATRYGLDGKGIEFRWGRNFQHPARPTLGPKQ